MLIFSIFYHPFSLWFIINSLVFFYRSKLLFSASGLPQFEGNLLLAQNNATELREAPFKPTLTYFSKLNLKWNNDSKSKVNKPLSSMLPNSRRESFGGLGTGWGMAYLKNCYKL